MNLFNICQQKKRKNKPTSRRGREFYDQKGEQDTKKDKRGTMMNKSIGDAEMIKGKEHRKKKKKGKDAEERREK